MPIHCIVSTAVNSTRHGRDAQAAPTTKVAMMEMANLPNKMERHMSLNRQMVFRQ